jgi:uncharacterized ferritin-like protein (DUF455 family)
MEPNANAPSALPEVNIAGAEITAAASPPPEAGDDVVLAALKILRQPDPVLKAEYAEKMAALWAAGSLAEAGRVHHGAAPSRPARPDASISLCDPGKVKRRGKGGSLASRQALLHSLVHIEGWAIDLACDAIARWGPDPDYACLPPEFFTDFVTVAADEARHFLALRHRLTELGAAYGDFPAHDGLWESAQRTAFDLPARLAVEHCCHEARGLDVLPQTIGRFRSGGDEGTAALLETMVLPEEIGHCAAGVRWILFLHAAAHRTGSVACKEGVPAWAEDARQHATPGGVVPYFDS